MRLFGKKLKKGRGEDFYAFPEKNKSRRTRGGDAEETSQCAAGAEETFRRGGKRRRLLPVASMYSMHLSMKTGMGFSGVTTALKGTPK